MLLAKQLILIDPNDEIPVEPRPKNDEKNWKSKGSLNSNIVHFPFVRMVSLFGQIRAIFNNQNTTDKLRVTPPVYASKDVHLQEMMNEFLTTGSHQAIVYDDIDLPFGNNSRQTSAAKEHSGRTARQRSQAPFSALPTNIDNHFVVTVKEKRKFLGIVTLEDIIEELLQVCASISHEQTNTFLSIDVDRSRVPTTKRKYEI